MSRERKLEVLRAITDEVPEEKLDELLALALNIRPSVQPSPPQVEQPQSQPRKRDRLRSGTGLFAVVSRCLKSQGVNGATEQELFDILRNTGEIGHQIELKHIVAQLVKGSSVFVKLPSNRWVYRRLLRGPTSTVKLENTATATN